VPTSRTAHALCMRPPLAALAMSQAGLVTRAQARSAGYRGPELRGLTSASGPWVVVRRGVYMEGSLWASLSPLDRWRARDRAAHLTKTVPMSSATTRPRASTACPLSPYVGTWRT
jgi:hypothetical protein